MTQEQEDKAIAQMKESFPALNNLNGRFYIECGMLWYEGFDCPIMEPLQVFINEQLGQKVFRAEYIGYKDVYAVSEEQAATFLDGIKPLVVRNKIYETPEFNF